jgi:hypothetical protein
VPGDTTAPEGSGGVPRRAPGSTPHEAAPAGEGLVGGRVSDELIARLTAQLRGESGERVRVPWRRPWLASLIGSVLMLAVMLGVMLAVGTTL